MTFDHDLLGMAPAAPLGETRSPAISVQPVSFRDLRRVASIQRRAFRPPLAYGLTTLIVLWLLPHVQFLVARQNGRIVGCAIGDKQAGQSRVINICVDPDARRQGAGGHLLRALEAGLPVGDVVLMVEDGNAAAQALYRQEGYVSVGVSRDYYGRGRDGIWMQKHRTKHSPSKIRV
jgi:ribosomal-protein-alanine N-acetyltransferase